MRRFGIALLMGGVVSLAAARPSSAASLLLDFEGLGDNQRVGNYYDTAPRSFGVLFSPNWFATIDSDDGGTGNFGGEPSSKTAASFYEGNAAFVNVSQGFRDEVSFYYSAANQKPGYVRIYDDFNGIGRVLAARELPLTPANGTPQDPGLYSPFVPIRLQFAGVAKSVEFGGTANNIGFDDIALNPQRQPPEPVPEPFSILGSMAALGWGWRLHHRKRGCNGRDVGPG